MPRISILPMSFINLIAMSLLPFIACKTVYSADAPAPKLVIQSALYGDLANEKTVDVTHKVAGMVKDDSLSVKASAENFGDPTPGINKKLRVGYTIDGLYRSKTVDEGEMLDISTRLVIRKAVYGDLPGGASTDVTEEVAAMVVKNSLTVKADNQRFGDPADGKVKSLRVDFAFDGKAMSKTIAENDTLTIAAPEK